MLGGEFRSRKQIGTGGILPKKIRNVRATDIRALADLEQSGFVVRRQTPIVAISRLLTILTLATMAVSVAFYYDDLRGAIIAISVGSAVIYIGRKLEDQERRQQATEFMNALFSSVLGEGYRFCTVVRQDGEIVYMNRSFQETFPTFVDLPNRNLKSLCSLLRIEDEQRDRIVSLVQNGVEGDVLVATDISADERVRPLNLSIKPIKRQRGFVLLRGQ